MLSRIIVSTDDPVIAEVARECGAEVPFLRPAELARDDSPEWLAWRHAVDQVGDFDVFVSLPATAPLRIGADVKACVETYLRGDCDMVITVRRAERHPSFNMVKLDTEGYPSLVLPLGDITRRQDAPPVYDMTTVAYVTSPGFIAAFRCLPGPCAGRGDSGRAGRGHRHRAGFRLCRVSRERRRRTGEEK
jgi:N-acylneuraminate cytidylyltransferase